MTSTRSCHGWLANLTRSASVRMQVTRVVFMDGTRTPFDGKLGRKAARERDHGV